MLYTDTDFFLPFYVDNLANEINARPQLRDAFDFSKIDQTPFSASRSRSRFHGGEVGYFKDETKGDPIVEFVGLRPKMYTFTECRALKYTPKHNDEVEMLYKNVATGISKFQIRRFKHEDYIRMYNGGSLENVFNRRIGSKLHQVRLYICFLHVNRNMGNLVFYCLQVYTIEQNKRGFCQ